MSTKQMSFTITDQPVIINGTEHQVTAVNGMDRVLINNKLHDLGEQILKLRMQQDELSKYEKETGQKATGKGKTIALGRAAARMSQ
jgi:hypothetical protein